MLGVLLLACVISLAGKLADIEGRNMYAWGLGTGAFAVGLIWFLDVFSIFAYVLALVGSFIGLWIAKAIDDKRAGRPF